MTGRLIIALVCLSFLQTSLPGILPGTSGVCLPHRGHLLGVRSVAMTTTFFLLSLCMFIEFATRGRCQWGSSLHGKILFCVPLKLGSSFLQYARHLTDFIHLSLLFKSIISMDWLPVSFIFFYDIKLRGWAPVYLKVPLLKWKQYTYYRCFTFQCMASRVTAHRHTKKYTYPSEWQAAQQSVREWCRIKGMAFN